MTNLKRRLKETFKPRKRRAISGVIIVIMVVVIGLAAVGLMSGTIFDLIDTTSVVDSLEITAPVVYSDQEYISVQVKNNGNTNLEEVQAYVLIADGTGATAAAANMYDCEPGSEKSVVGAISLTRDISPGQSVTIRGDLKPTDAGWAEIDCDGTGTALPTNGIENRGEYIIQVEAKSDGSTTINAVKTIPVRAR